MKQETLEEVSPMQELIILLDKIKKNLTNKNEVITIQLIIDTVKNQFVDKELKWQKEQDKNKYIALETAISLLKQTTEYEVLDSWKEKVKELEQFKKEKDL
jgi:hypothetical protein